MKKIIAIFTDNRQITYTSQIFDLLTTDENITIIIDADTGEILHEKARRGKS